MFVFVCLSMYLFVSVYVSLCAFVCENVRIKYADLVTHYFKTVIQKKMQ